MLDRSEYMNLNNNVDRHLSDPLGSSSAQLCSFYIDVYNLYIFKIFV